MTGSPTSASAPEAGASTLGSSWLCPALERSVWWRGKPSPSRTWSKRCEAVSWLQRLCGAMPEPSMADAGVAAWVASLAASPASRTAGQESGSSHEILGTCGERRDASSYKPVAGGCSSRTSAECSQPPRARLPAPSACGETYSAWVSRLREDYSRRLRSALRRNANGSSSSLWQTPSVADTSGGRANRSGERSGELLLNGQVRVLCSRLGLTSWTPGAPISDATPRSSPDFLEALMGWPNRWTAGACSGTELSRFRRRMRSALSALGSPPEAPPAQLGLFG